MASWLLLELPSCLFARTPRGMGLSYIDELALPIYIHSDTSHGMEQHAAAI